MGTEDFLGSGNGRLDRQLLFSAEVDALCSVARRSLHVDGSARENDAEHSWHIALMATLFSEYAAESVDTARAVEMCLVHDLVEIRAGDTFAYDEAGNADKAERERAAADEIFASLPEDQGRRLRSLWEEFDARETADAKYAACMDSLQPLLHNTLTGGATWREGNVARAAVERRMDVIRRFLPQVYAWVERNLDRAVEMGWLRA